MEDRASVAGADARDKTKEVNEGAKKSSNLCKKRAFMLVQTIVATILLAITGTQGIQEPTKERVVSPQFLMKRHVGKGR